MHREQSAWNDRRIPILRGRHNSWRHRRRMSYEGVDIANRLNEMVILSAVAALPDARPNNVMRVRNNGLR